MHVALCHEGSTLCYQPWRSLFWASGGCLLLGGNTTGITMMYACSSVFRRKPLFRHVTCAWTCTWPIGDLRPDHYGHGGEWKKKKTPTGPCACYWLTGSFNVARQATRRQNKAWRVNIGAIFLVSWASPMTLSHVLPKDLRYFCHAS
jgi:hypothetical protein